MKIRSTLNLVAITCGILVATNLAPQMISARAQGTTPIGKKDRQPQYTSFPTAGVKLIRPDGFEAAESFDGFQQASTQSSVMLVTIPGPFTEVTNGLTAERLKTRGMTLRSQENVTIDGNQGILISLTQTAYGIDFAKWIVAFGNDKETKMVTATFPKTRTAKLSASLKSVVLTAKNDTTPPPTLGSDLGFKIVASNKVKLARSMGKMLLYTKDGTIPAKSPEDPIFIVAPSFSQITISDKQEFATRRLSQTSSIKINSVTTTDTITIDGLDGYEIFASAQDIATGTPVVIYQVMLFDDRSYTLIQGIVGTKVRDEYLPEFKAMARSFKKQQK
ncbi:hypothetical protein [Chamaesiphon sp. VAR_48_metabat_135_sub]|uniref:hypothetical protein n=1 Tax=Chamaesiphon sp. VAR_48_metabat_135_sub TaxID=2964699 RepID=UPI00286D1EEB|nr:hypothetical protein [Chamaesiphon sp. VAR_48_metabat_135_sub]